MKWDIFICHASEDKEEVAEPIARELEKRGLNVWLDKSCLKLGDSLRRTIEEGLANSSFGVVILSPNFIKKEWPQSELDGLTSKETDGVKVILPVWHKVGREDIIKISPILSDKIGISTTNGIEAICNSIIDVVGKEPDTNRIKENVQKLTSSEEAKNECELPRIVEKKSETIIVAIQVMTTGEIHSVELSIDARVSGMKNRLLAIVGLPTKFDNGWDVPYEIQSLNRRITLDEGKTFRENGVSENEVLVFVTKATVGG